MIIQHQVIVFQSVTLPPCYCLLELPKSKTPSWLDRFCIFPNSLILILTWKAGLCHGVDVEIRTCINQISYYSTWNLEHSKWMPIIFSSLFFFWKDDVFQWKQHNFGCHHRCGSPQSRCQDRDFYAGDVLGGWGDVREQEPWGDGKELNCDAVLWGAPELFWNVLLQGKKIRPLFPLIDQSWGMGWSCEMAVFRW